MKTKGYLIKSEEIILLIGLIQIIHYRLLRQ